MTRASIASTLKSKFKSKIVKGAAGAFGLRLIYTGLTFITSILLARTLGTTGYGTYSYVIVWAYLLSVPATLGFDNFIVREIAIYQTQSLWGLTRGILIWANRTVFLVSVGLVLVAAAIAWVLAGGVHSEIFVGFCVAMALMPALSLRNVSRGAMRGLYLITQGLLPELLIDPLILIVLTVCAYLVLREDLTALWIIAFYGVGTVTTLIIIHRLLNRALPTQVKTAQPMYKGHAWLRGALPFMLLESIPIINAQTDVLMLGAFRGVEAVGLYVPVNRGAQLITFILMAVGSTLAPTIASAYADNKLIDLQQMITKSVRVIAGIAFLFAASLIIGGNWYLALFGAEFVQGQRALYILCVGSFTSTAIGLAAVILNMTGHERYTAMVGWITTVLNIVLNAVLIPLWGIEGAALATSISIVLGGFMSLIAVRQKLGLDATLMGLSANFPRQK
jgi:O-antigen/teichoic acid export membrane protein